MSKRRSEQSAQGGRKRTKGIPAFGGPSDADLLQEAQTAPSANAFSVRKPFLATPPSLISMCIEVYARNITEIHEEYNDDARYYLKLLPDQLATRVFAGVRRERPGVLSQAFMEAYFLRGSEIVLTGEMTGVNKQTIDSAGKIGPVLRNLEITGLPKISDNVFASAIKKLPNLETLNLRGCTKAGVETAKAVARCKQLTKLNMSFTTPTPISLVQVLGSCGELQVLKLSGVPNLTSQVFVNYLPLVTELGQTNGIVPLAKLTCLKLSQTRINDAALLPLADYIPQLQRLDVSFTGVQSLSVLEPPDDCTMSLEKLKLTSTPLKVPVLVERLPKLQNLRTLNLGAVGDPLVLTDALLFNLTDKLVELAQLEHISLVGNNRLGATKPGDHALADFVSRVGRRCKSLSLGGIHNLVSQDLHGLLDGDDTPPKLISLNLSNTSIDDRAAVYLSMCNLLTYLELANTKITESGVFEVIDACPLLIKLDLTSCRSIRVTERRRVFDAWEESRNPKQEEETNIPTRRRRGR